MVSNLAGLLQGLDDNLLNTPPSPSHTNTASNLDFSLRLLPHQLLLPLPLGEPHGKTKGMPQAFSNFLCCHSLMYIQPLTPVFLLHQQKKILTPPSYSCPHRKQSHPPSLSMPSGFLLSGFLRDHTLLTIFCDFIIRLPKRVSILHTSSSIFLTSQLISDPLLLSFNWC